jgi:5-methylcytosine-specific restriction endonuclease McrA
VSDAALRQQVRERAAQRCEYCRLPDWLPAFEPFHLEHIVARQHGGETELGNLAWACHRCNRYKGPNLSGIDPSSQEITPLFHPRRASWTAHFILRGIELAGLTPNGRATVVLLQMNSARRLE